MAGLPLADAGVDSLGGSLTRLGLAVESLDVRLDVISQRQPELRSGTDDASAPISGAMATRSSTISSDVTPAPSAADVAHP